MKSVLSKISVCTFIFIIQQWSDINPIRIHRFKPRLSPHCFLQMEEEWTCILALVMHRGLELWDIIHRYIIRTSLCSHRWKGEKKMIILCVFAKQCKELLELQHCHVKIWLVYVCMVWAKGFNKVVSLLIFCIWMHQYDKRGWYTMDVNVMIHNGRQCDISILKHLNV